MTAYELLIEVNEKVCGLFSTERPQTKASRSELRRWFQKNAIIINGTPARESDLITEITSLVLFPKGNRKTTLF